MNVMIFTPGFPPWRLGGEEYYSFYQSKNLTDLGHLVYVIAENDGNMASVCKDGRLKISLVKSGIVKPRLFKNMIIMLRYLVVALKLRAKPDVIHGHDTMGPGLAAVLAGKILRVPVVITWHAAELRFKKRFSFIGNLARKFVCKYADGVIVNSELFKSLALENVGERYAHKFFVIPPGVDTFEFHPRLDGKKIRSELGISDSLVVLSVGRLERVKGFEFLIKAIPYVLKSSSNTSFVIVGDGSQKESLSKLADTLNVRKNVIFTGFVPRPRLPYYYSACDIFLVPTRSEGFGMVFLEAWSCGKPVIVTPNAPAIVILIRRRGGGIVSTNDPAKLGKALVTLLSDKNLRLEMGKIGREIALDFSWRKMVEKSLSLYRNFTK